MCACTQLQTNQQQTSYHYDCFNCLLSSLLSSRIVCWKILCLWQMKPTTSWWHSVAMSRVLSKSNTHCSYCWRNSCQLVENTIHFGVPLSLLQKNKPHSAQFPLAYNQFVECVELDVLVLLTYRFFTQRMNSSEFSITLHTNTLKNISSLLLIQLSFESEIAIILCSWNYSVWHT